DPSVHVIVEDAISGIFGPARSRFTRLVEGQGWAFCIKFRPGGFFPFTRSSVAGFKSKTLSLHDVFGTAGKALETSIRAATTEANRIEIAECFLRSQTPERDESATLIHEVIDWIIANREVTRGHELEKQFHLTQRTLQRLFSRYVGVSPGWVIRR